MSVFVWRRLTAPSLFVMEPSTSASPDVHATVPFWPRFRNAVALLSVAVAAHVWVVRAPLPVPEATSAEASVTAPQRSPSPTAAASESTLPGASLPSTARPVRRDVPILTRVALDGVPTSSTTGDSFAARRSSAGVNRRSRLFEAENRARAPRDPQPVGTAGITKGPSAKVPPGSEPAPAPLLPVASPRTPAATTQSLSLPAMNDALAAPSGGDGDTALALMGGPAGSPVVAGVSESTADPMSEEKQDVLEVLQQYKQAYERLDVKAAQAVQPSLNGRALKRAFRDLDGQELRFAECKVVSVSGPTANAKCRGEATYRPKIGSGVMHRPAQEWTFSLSRHENRWEIVRADMSANE